MEKKIKVVLIGNYPEDKIKDIKDRRFPEPYYESGFEIVHFIDDTDICQKLYSASNFDAIITFYSNKDYEESGKTWNEYFYLLYPHLFEISPVIHNKWISIDENESSDKVAEFVINTFFKAQYYFQQIPGMFSIITPCYNTSEEMFMRLYNSIKNQTYKNWEWFILDDSDNGVGVKPYLDKIKDFRIRCLSNVTNHGNVGYNKRILGMAAHGEFILEVDHDDELMPECCQKCAEAFEKYPDCGFVYSNGIELKGPESIIEYGEGWAYGQGLSKEFTYKGKTLYGNYTPNINEISIRSIMSAPNHVRVWLKAVYDKINGHNYNYSIVDDYELIVRTFLETKFCYVPDFLYVQHREYETTQYTRNREIQRCNQLVKEIYDERIHNRILELGYKDSIWDENQNCSIMVPTPKPLNQKFNYIYV